MEKPDALISKATATQNSAQPATNAEMKVGAPKAIANARSNPSQPNKQVQVPKYAVCMAGDAKPIEGVIHAVAPKPPKGIQAVTPKESGE